MTTEKTFEKSEDGEKREGQIQDFVSGHWVKAGPEEVDAVQIFSRRLIEDYDYPKTHIQTRPQYRVRKRPSDEEKSYPVDIAVFKNGRRIEDDLFMVVECKKKNRKDGLVGISHHSGRSFRCIPAGCFARFRPPISEHSGHPGVGVKSMS